MAVETLASARLHVPYEDQHKRLNIGWVNECSLEIVSGVSGTPKQVVPHMLEQGHEVTMIHPGPTPGLIEGVHEIITPSIDMREFGKEFIVGRFSTKKFKKLFEERHFDVIIVGSPFRTPKPVGLFLGGYAIDAARKVGIPTTALAQTNNKRFAEDQGFGAAVALVDKQERRMHGRADLNLSPSEATDQYLLDLDVEPDRIERWTRGIAEIFDPKRRETHAATVAELHKTWGVQKGETVVLAVGRLAAEKAFHKLNILVGVPGIKLVLAGDGPERPELEKLLGGDTKFLGMLGPEDLANAYATADILVNTSVTDTYCQVVTEAQRAGLAVVAADRGGPSGLIQHGQTGFKYEPAGKHETDEQLLHFVKVLADNPELVKKLQNQAHHSVEGLTWAGKSQELIQFCRQAIDLQQARIPNRYATQLAAA